MKTATQIVESGRTAARLPPATQYTLRIGPERFPVGSLSHASILFQDLRDASGAGARDWPDGEVTGDGNTYRISYNGRVWLGPVVHLEA